MAIVCELAGEDGRLRLTFGGLLPGADVWVECALEVVSPGREWSTEDSGMTPEDFRGLVIFGRREVHPEWDVADRFESYMENLQMQTSEVDGGLVVWGTVESNTSALAADEDDDHASDGVNFRFSVTAEALSRFADDVEAAAATLGVAEVG